MEKSFLYNLMLDIIYKSTKNENLKFAESVFCLSKHDADYVICIMLEEIKKSNASDTAAVNIAMSRIETLFTINKKISLILMNSLKVKASNLFMHDVYDAIELWNEAENT
jgi:hypothetical protein